MQYRLVWAEDDVTRSPDGAAWAVTSDLGYRVHLTRGWVTSYSMELVECPKAATRSPLWFPMEGTAWAGHSTGTPNPAAIRMMQVESLTDSLAREVGTVSLAPQVYCALHYLVARAGNDAPGLPAELDMVDTSLHLEGTERAPGASSDMPFTVHTATAYGQLFERVNDPPAALRVDTGRGSTRVSLRRHLGRLFDGVDFAHMSERVVAQRILQSLVDHVDVEIVPLDGAS